jgi:integrase
MSSISTNKKTGTRRLMFQVSKGGARCQIYLGRLPLKQAEAIRRRVDVLIAAKRSNSPVDPETADWLAAVDRKLREDFVKHGLAEPSAAELELTLEELIDKFYQSQAVKPATLAAYKQATDSLLAHFGKGSLIRRLVPQQLEAWHKSLHSSGLAQATVTKRVNIAKAVFGRAVRWGMIDQCPLQNVKRGSQVNPARQHYVSDETVTAVLAACPDDESRLIVALARYAGLRCPSEMVDLRWRDIELENNVIRVRSSKLAAYGQKSARDVPVTPQVRAALLQVGFGSPDQHVVPRISSKSTNMRKMLETAVRRAGLNPWPRLFQNLRASCEMDWATAAGHHAAAAWIGHSLEVSAKHYVLVRDDHFEKVTGRKAGNAQSDAHATRIATQHVSAPQSNNPQLALQGPVEGEVVLLGAAPCGAVPGNLMGDTGFEPVTPRV